jgi:hypothetical protein
MPSKSKAQHNLMAAVANNPKFAKKAGISQTVGADYMKADKAKKYNMGGMTGTHKMPDGTMMKDSEHKMAGGMKYNNGGAIRGYGMARGGKVCKMV